MNDTTWPDGTRKSWGNAFTHGYGPQPHGYVAGLSSNVTLLPMRKARRDPMGGFGATNGTLYGLGKRDNAPTMYTRKKAAAA
jgi:hypothetical protein